MSYHYKLDDLFRVPDSDLLIKMLDSARIDMFVTTDRWLNTYLKEKSLAPDAYQIAFTVFQVDGGFAFNQKIPDATVQKFAEAMSSLKKKGVLQKLFNQYLK